MTCDLQAATKTCVSSFLLQAMGQEAAGAWHRSMPGWGGHGLVSFEALVAMPAGGHVQGGLLRCTPAMPIPVAGGR